MNRRMGKGMRQIVIFKLGKEDYGIDIMEVVEIILHQEIRSMPETPDYIEGIVNLRGDIHPIYNLRTRFNMETREPDEDTKIIVIRTPRMNIGFIVDSVSEILNISTQNIEDAPMIISAGEKSRYINGVAKEEGRIIVLLDVDQLVSSDDETVINKMIE